MLKRPPEHRADAPITYVHPADTAWDRERIKREQEEMRQRGEDPTTHPYARYQGGFTRYDLDAQCTLGDTTVTVRDYLDATKAPTLWHLRRLGFQEWYVVQPLWERDVRKGERPIAAYLQACTLGIKSVENGPQLEGPPDRLTLGDLEKLYDLSRSCPELADLIHEIGEAVYQASMPLSDDEKKV